MRALWPGETVTHYGRVCTAEAKLYTRPTEPPPLFGAALTAETAQHRQWAGNLLGPAALATLRMPAEFAAAARHVSVDDVCSALPVGADLDMRSGSPRTRPPAPTRSTYST